MERPPTPVERAGVRLVTLAAALLPPSLRERWMEALLETFRERQRHLLERGGPGELPLLWARECVGLLVTAYRARRPDGWSRRTGPGSPAGDRPSLSPGPIMDHLLSDLRFALRTFARRPAMMGLAAASLALGIGASTAMFSVVDTVLLRPLPVEDPEALVSVYPTNPELAGHPTLGGAAVRGTFSWPELFWVEENQTVFEAFGGWVDWQGATLAGEGPPERLEVIRASPGVLPTLGIEPLAGRLFTPEDHPSTGARTVLLTEAFWRARFGADPDRIGSTLRLDDEAHTVIGILPEAVSAAAAEGDVWLLQGGSSSEGNWGDHGISGAVGRLRPGVGIEQAREEVLRLLDEVPSDGHAGHGASVFPRLEDRTRHVRPALLVLVAASFLLLIVGCGNVAAILLGAGIDRQQEIAVRGALGADRGRLTRQLLTESLVLAGVGALGGLLLSALITQGLLHLAPPYVPRIDQAGIDGRVLAFATGVAGLAGILFGVAPAVGLSRPDLAGIITSSRGTTRGRGRLQSAVVVGELALATVLLVSAALLVRTLVALNRVDTGVRTEGLVAVRLAPPFQRFGQEDEEARRAALDAYFQRLVDEVAAIPGVERVAVTSNVPLTGDRTNNNVWPEGWETGDESLIAERRFVSGGYFETTGIRIVEGRALGDADNRFDAPPTMVVSEGLAERAWPGESAIGKRMSFWSRDPATVVGVAADVRDEALDRETSLAFYVPFRQVTSQSGSLLLRVTGDPGSVAPSVRERIYRLDPAVAVTEILTFDEILASNLGDSVYRARLMAAFAALAVIFALLGVYGVTARSVSRRTREMGIRLALGAERAQVRGLVLRQGVQLALWGGLLGIASAFFATRYLEDLLYGVGRMDVVSLIGIAAAVAVGSVAASLGPSRRAMRVDPMIALREE